MSKYDVPNSHDVGFEPGSDNLVLKNKLGITDEISIHYAETNALTLAIENSYEWVSNETIFNFSIHQRLHKEWLSSIYDFAGELRTVDMSKSSVMFCPWQNVESELLRFDQEVVASSIESSQEFLPQLLAKMHAEFILIHPFREGNGRVGRWVLELMVLQHENLNFNCELSKPKDKENYFYALRKAFKMDYKPLGNIIDSWIS